MQDLTLQDVADLWILGNCPELGVGHLEAIWENSDAKQ